jgi:5-dehydro-2-deoxygluconokinase
MTLGYTKDLFILPFDHRASFLKKMFGLSGKEPTEEEVEKVKKAKEIIYEGYKKALSQGMPKESSAILIDEQFGDELLRDAHENNFIIILTTEKSSQKEFEFEYGEEFDKHIKKYDPTFVKALVQYNPEGEKELNARQREKLAILTKFAHDNGYKLLIEPLIPGTIEQLAKYGGDPDKYDEQLRPYLTSRMIREMQEGGVNPDVWKLEGMSKKEDYQMAVQQARADGRDNVGIVILGRAAEINVVENWIKVGACVPGVIGFAIGRTIFWDPIMQFEEGKMSEDEASGLISKRFLHYYHIFIEARQGL